MYYYIALMICAFGILLGSWAIVFRDQDRLRIFLISIGLFAVPISLLVLDNYLVGLLWWIPYIAVIALEEGLKALGSRLPGSKRQALCLVSLFGIWEILITKIARVFFQDVTFYSFLNQNYGNYTAVSLVSFAMHSTTAIIYCLMRTRYIIFPFLISIAIHYIFNYTRDYYYIESAGKVTFNVSFIWFDVLSFAIMWLALWLLSRRRGGELR